MQRIKDMILITKRRLNIKKDKKTDKGQDLETKSKKNKKNRKKVK